MAGVRAGQMDLFAASGETSKEDAPAPSAATIVALPAPDANPKTRIERREAMARELEASGDYRILRRLTPRPTCGRPDPSNLADGKRRLGLILDTETTGLDYRTDELIELGMVLFAYDENSIGEVIDVFSELRDPGRPIPPEVVRITGITDEMVQGHRIDPEAVAAFIEAADCVIAHNAKFDRPFCEAFVPAFTQKRWGCSVAEIDWAGLGFEGSKLGYLIGQCGYFHNGHRAVDDCHALLEVLDHPCADGTTSFARLARAMDRRCARIWAVGSPFEAKDTLKARGYRWNDGSNGQPKSWWIEVDEADFETEERFLTEAIYRSKTKLRVDWLTAVERFRAA